MTRYGVISIYYSMMTEGLDKVDMKLHCYYCYFLAQLI